MTTSDDVLIRGIQACGLTMACGVGAQHLITYPEAKRILEYVRAHDNKQDKETQDIEGTGKA